MVLKFLTMKMNCLLALVVGNMVQLFHQFIKITVSCHGIKTLYCTNSMITCLHVLCTLQQHLLESKPKYWLNDKSAKTTVVRPYNHPFFILLVYMIVVI